MNWILEEHKKGAIFGIRRPFVADQSKKYEIFGRTLETPFGPAAGPHTQLTQNIVAAYVAGSRFFELKTVQKLDGEDLPVAKPCIKLMMSATTVNGPLSFMCRRHMMST